MSPSSPTDCGVGPGGSSYAAVGSVIVLLATFLEVKLKQIKHHVQVYPALFGLVQVYLPYLIVNQPRGGGFFQTGVRRGKP
jgi:hypothetical protein